MRVLLSELAQAKYETPALYSKWRYEISHRCSRSPKYSELSFFTLLLCSGKQRNVRRFLTYVHSHCLTSFLLPLPSWLFQVSIVYDWLRVSPFAFRSFSLTKTTLQRWPKLSFIVASDNKIPSTIRKWAHDSARKLIMSHSLIFLFSFPYCFSACRSRVTGHAWRGSWREVYIRS